MKEELNKKELKKYKVIKYDSINPNVTKAEIITYEYRNKTLYQPAIVNNNMETIINRCSYYDIDDAKRCIDRYCDNKNLK